MKIISVLILSILAVAGDAKTFKIYNLHTIFFAISGVAANLFFYGLYGLRLALLGWLLPVSCLFALYALRMLGAGDIKLIGAIGAIMGPSFAFYVTAYSFFAGALIALVFIITGKNAGERIKYFFTYVKNCFLTMRLKKYGEFTYEKGKGHFRFAYAVLPAVIFHVIKQ